VIIAAHDETSSGPEIPKPFFRWGRRSELHSSTGSVLSCQKWWHAACASWAASGGLVKEQGLGIGWTQNRRPRARWRPSAGTISLAANYPFRCTFRRNFRITNLITKPKKRQQPHSAAATQVL